MIYSVKIKMVATVVKIIQKHHFPSHHQLHSWPLVRSLPPPLRHFLQISVRKISIKFWREGHHVSYGKEIRTLDLLLQKPLSRLRGNFYFYYFYKFVFFHGLNSLFLDFLISKNKYKQKQKMDDKSSGLDVNATDFWQKVLPQAMTAHDLLEEITKLGGKSSITETKTWFESGKKLFMKNLRELVENIVARYNEMRGGLPPDKDTLHSVLVICSAHPQFFNPSEQRQIGQWVIDIDFSRRRRHAYLYTLKYTQINAQMSFIF